MDTLLFVQGLLIGLSIAAPVGPVGLLCIVRTLSSGRLSGLVSGLGAATADGLYGCLGGFGVTFLAHHLIEEHAWFRLVGGIFLICLGVKTVISRPREGGASADRTNLLADFGSTFVITLTNPMTILSFAAVFASLGVGMTPDTRLDAVTLITGIFSGSALWWLALSLGVGLIRRKISSHQLGWVNKTGGTIIVGFGIVALVSLAA